MRRRSLTACSLILAASMLSASFSALTPTNPPLAYDQPQKAIISAYTSHAPILIDGNTGFLGPNASTGISWGSGTASDPYIIGEWDINTSSSNGIDIRNSDVYFIIRDCYIHGGNFYVCIYLLNCSNGVLERNTCSNMETSIYLKFSSNNTLSYNNCSNNNEGIVLGSSDSNALSYNTCWGNHYGIYLYSSSNNTVSYNTCWDNYDGISLYDSSNDTLSYNTCSSNNNDGISLYDSSNDTLSYNTCSSNNDFGIYLNKSSDNTISNNDCSGNAKEGIFLSENPSSDDNILINNYLGESGLPTMYLAVGAISASIVVVVIIILLRRKKKEGTGEKAENRLPQRPTTSLSRDRCFDK